MRILITGGTSYIGYRLIGVLLRKGYDVQAICRPTSNIERLTKLSGKINIGYFHGGYSDLVGLLTRMKPHCVVHVAAATPQVARDTEIDLIRYLEGNVIFPAYLLEAMVAAKIRCFVNTESYWQYGESTDSYSRSSLYATTKTAFKEVLSHYAFERHINCISLILGDTYGPEDWRGKILSTLKASLVSGVEVEMSAGNQYMSLTHVDDIAEAYVIAIKNLVNNDHTGLSTYTVGLEDPLRLRDIVAVAEDVTSSNFNVKWGVRPMSQGSSGIIPKGQILPGWAPTISLKKGLFEFFKGP